MSSGLVGSSIQYGSNSASRLIHPTASSTPQRWLASSAIRTPGPITSRAVRHRRTSSSRSAPTLSLICLNPLSTASRANPATLLSE